MPYQIGNSDRPTQIPLYTRKFLLHNQELWGASVPLVLSLCLEYTFVSVHTNGMCSRTLHTAITKETDVCQRIQPMIKPYAWNFSSTDDTLVVPTRCIIRRTNMSERDWWRGHACCLNDAFERSPLYNSTHAESPTTSECELCS